MSTEAAATLKKVEVGAEVIAKFTSYDAYRDSHQLWIGEVPAHWKLPPLYARYVCVLGKMLDAKRITGEHLLPYVRNVDVQWDSVSVVDLPEMDIEPDELERFTIRPNDLLICEGGEVGRTAIWRGELAQCAFQKAIHRLHPHSTDEEPRFLYYCMRFAASTDIFIADGNPNTIPHLTGEKLRLYRFPTPPLSEQRAIAAFLDRETAKIDALVEKKRRLIKLLKEKRAALISHAIGGQPSLPEVKLKYCVDILPGFAFPSSGFSNAEDDVRLLRGANIAPGSVVWDDTVRWPADDTVAYSEYDLRVGDIVFGMDRPWIGAGIRVAEVTEHDVPSLLLQRVARLRAHSGLLQDYLALLLGSKQFVAYFEPILTGVSVPHISEEQIGSFRFRKPAIQAQREICSRVARESRIMDRLCRSICSAIDRLLEYRTALISAAVTGKIDVRESNSA